MNTSSLETTDIFRGAFFMCMGGDLQDIRFRSNGKQIATFSFTGEDLHKHDNAYRNGRAPCSSQGQALVNPLQFREALNHLRDILFESLRQNQREEMRYDRKRQDRVHQTVS
ncbi:MAG: hypothetical protein WA081_04085 [Desulfosalsimonadaceae bacterium]